MAAEPHRAERCYTCDFHYLPIEAHNQVKCLANLQKIVSHYHAITAKWELTQRQAQEWWQAHSPQAR
mgnify:FL=1